MPDVNSKTRNPTPITKALRVNGRLLEAIAKWAYPGPDRPHLSMVLFTKNEAVACDGHRMVIAPIPFRGPAFGVDRTHLIAAVAAQRSLSVSSDIQIDRDGDLISLAIAPGVKLVAPWQDATKYPPYEQVNPKRVEGRPLPEPYGFDARYMAAIDEVDRAARDGGPSQISVLAWGGPMDAMMYEGFGGIRYIVMPVRITDP